jgi:BT1 family
MRNPRLDLSGGVWRWAVVIGAGIFATTLAQSGALDLPLRNLLITKFKVAELDPCAAATGSLHTIAQFFAIAAFPWYFKFVFGVFSDSVPFLGTMRRHYVLWSGTAAAALWVVAGLVPHSYFSLLAIITAMETMLVVCSTVIGALLVEVGQRLDAAGRLVAARMVVEGICAAVAGPLAGALAGVPFVISAMVGAIVALTVVPVAFMWLNEPATAKYEVSAIADVRGELRRIFQSRTLWIAAGFIFVASVPQVFPTPLWNFQKCEMGLSDTTIGYLRAAAGAGSTVVALIYGVIYRQFALRNLIAVGIVASSVGSLSYVFYGSLPAAFAIEIVNGFLTTLWILAMMEMAVWVAPKAAEAAAFALLMGAYNLGIGIGDYLFSDLADWGVLGLSGVAKLSALGTILMIILLRLLPNDLFGPSAR